MSESSGTQDPAGRIFLSYASQDADVARRIGEALQGAGIQVWFDQSGLKGGAAWDAEIRRQIHDCALFVPLISAHTEQRREGYFRLEWRLADQRTHMMAEETPFLVPVVIDDTPEERAHVPHSFVDVQWTRLPGGNNAASFARHVKSLLAQADIPPPTHGSVHAESPPLARAQQRRSFAMPASATAALLLVAAAVVAWVSWDKWTGRALTPQSSSAPAAAGPTAIPTAAPAPRTAVAVLPFANLTGDASKEYLGDGMAEELINTLNKVSGLKVPARTSSFAYKGRNINIRDIAKDLQVGTILEGSVRAAGKRIRIAAQLINAQDGLPLWSQSYDEEFTDIFMLQDKLATQIAKALQPSLSGAALAAAAQGPPTQDVEAYNLYLQGESLLNNPGPQPLQGIKKAIEYFELATGRDPGFASAYAGIAAGHLNMMASGDSALQSAAAENYARKALALNPNLARAYSALADAAASRGEYMQGELHARRAVALAPDDGRLRMGYAQILAFTGRNDQAVKEAQTAYAAAPAVPIVVGFAARIYAQAGRDTDALRFANKAADLGSNRNGVGLRETDWLLALRGRRYKEAADFAASYLRAPTEQKSDNPAFEVTRLVHAALADPSRRELAIAASARLYPKTGGDPIHEYGVRSCLRSSTMYGLLQANDVAYELANRCLDAGAAALITPTIWLPELRAFRQDPRFHTLVTRMGLMELFQQYGPPDDCKFENNRLTCH